jgi:hypothetical protein
MLPEYSVEKTAMQRLDRRGFRFRNKSLLNYVLYLFEHLVVRTTPIEVRCRYKDRPDISWMVNRKGEGWTVTMFNYSCARESIVSKFGGTAKIHATHPLKEVPFQILCHTPTEDILEWYQDRDVSWKKVNSTAVVSETMHGGEIRVYEFQPGKIELGKRERYVNYALNQSVKASSTLKGYSPQQAVNGDLNQHDYWWSDTDPRRHYAFDMPQWLEVDFGQPHTIDHAFVLFHWWNHESLQSRLRVYKYIVEASLDGKDWKTVIDESRNEDNASKHGLERWFEPTQARYVKLTILRNSSFGGARVIELKVMGKEKESYQPVRKSILPPWEVQYPTEGLGVSKENTTWLLDLTPTKGEAGWLPAGQTWQSLSGDIKLLTDRSRGGRVYSKSIYGQASSEFVYSLEGKYKTFVAAAGIGTIKADASVEFIVYVDGKRKYKSDPYRIGQPVLPVVVDVRGAKVLKLVITDAGDGIRNDYAWWGEARLLK